MTEPDPPMELLRTAIVRAVRQVCPAWLASQREDIAQEACLRVVRKLERGEEPAALKASYLWKVAHSAVMDEIRRRRRRPEAPMDGTSEPVADGPEPHRAGSSGEIRAAIDHGLDRLPTPRRSAVLLFLYGYTLRESAEILGWPAKRVDNQRYRGLAALREYLREQGFEP